MPISEYDRKTLGSESIQAARIASPVTSGVESINKLSGIITEAVVKSEAANAKAEFNEYQAQLKMQMMDQRMSNVQVQGKNVLADPNAPGNPDDPYNDGTLNLFDRTKQGLTLGKDAFVSLGSTKKVRQALSLEYDEQSVELLGATGDWQIKQQNVFQEASKEKASAATTAELVASPGMDLSLLIKTKSEMFDIYENNPAKAEQKFNTALIESTKQQARENPRLTDAWLKQNEKAIDRLAPGVYTTLQDEVRTEKLFQKQQNSIALADADRRKKDAREKADANAVELANDAMLRTEGAPSMSEAARTINDDPLIGSSVKKSLIAALKTEMRAPIATDQGLYSNLNAGASIGALDRVATDQALKDQQLSVGEYNGLIKTNTQALDNLDENAKEEFKGAITFLKDMFQTQGPFGDMWGSTKSKQQYRMAVNLLRQQYYALDKGKRNEFFATEVNEAGLMYMPNVYNIYQQASAMTEVQAQTLTGPTTSIEFNPDSDLPETEKFKAMDAVLKE